MDETGFIKFDKLNKIIDSLNITQIDSDIIDYLVYKMKKGLYNDIEIEELRYTV